MYVQIINIQSFISTVLNKISDYDFKIIETNIYQKQCLLKINPSDFEAIEQIVKSQGGSLIK